VEIVDAPAERLPFPDESFDAVVGTLVLCSVPDPAACLAEVHRVLRPGGRLVFVEHVAATDRDRLHRWQQRLEPLWKRVAGGCHLTRPTEQLIVDAGFSTEGVEHGTLHKAPPVVRPLVAGSAVRS
jgi:ubiquinone/menaquinone biosynthesis C-methylase UbiE